MKHNPSVLLEKIEEKRIHMIEIALKYGFTAAETVRASQELDALLDVYQKAEQAKYALNV